MITNNEVPPALIALGEKDFATRGRLAVTASKSTTVQVPAEHPVAVFVLVTPSGAEIEAVLVICVCAVATCDADSTSIPASTNAIALVLWIIARITKVKRFNTFAFTNVYSEFYIAPLQITLSSERIVLILLT